MKPSKEIFDLVVEVIRQERKQRPQKPHSPSILDSAESVALRKHPNDALILLDTTQNAELKGIGTKEVRNAINWLEIVEKVLKDCSPHQTIFTGQPYTFPNVIYTDPDRFSLLIFESFDDWYSAYMLQKKNTVDNLSKLNLEKVFALILDIDDKLQVNPSPKITIGIRSINAWRFKELQGNMIVDIGRRVKEFRKDALDYLQGQDVINYYEFNIPMGEVDLTLNIPKFQELKAEVIKIYPEWEKKNEQQDKKEAKKEPVKLTSNVKWQDITIQFKDGHNVNIKIKDKTEQSDYKQMGFEDKRTRKPDKQWELLQKLSELNGELSWKSYPESKNFDKKLTEQSFDYEEDEEKDDNKQNRGFSYKKAPDSIKKTKQLLAEKLKAFFEIKEDPFFPYHKERSYKIKINLISS